MDQITVIFIIIYLAVFIVIVLVGYIFIWMVFVLFSVADILSIYRY